MGIKNMAEDTPLCISGFAAWPFTLFTIYTPAGLVEFELFLWLCFFSALVESHLLFSCSGNVVGANFQMTTKNAHQLRAIV